MNDHDVDDIATEVCVVGAGAAGITLTRALLAAGHSVTLLESGGLDYEPATADLNAGQNIGEEYYELDHARLRFFGGTTAIWGGRIAEFDPIDFAERAWVPYSGWPLTYEELRPYYKQARALFEVPCQPVAVDEFAASGVPLPPFAADKLALKTWSFDRRFNRFVFASCQDLRSHPRCTIVTHATVTEIETDAEASRVTSLRVRSTGGRQGNVTAKVFVLAAGGIENPRLLLASRAAMPAGLGNGHDLVGRFFMEHPHARGGRVLSRHAWTLLKAFGRRHRVGPCDAAALIVPGERAQAEHAMLNSSLTIAARQPAGRPQFWGMQAYNRVKHKTAPDRLGRNAWMYVKRAATWGQMAVDPLRPWLLHKLGRVELALVVRAEQAPNPASRVMLSTERDQLGMPRVSLDWRMGELEVHSVERLVALLDSELARLGLGRAEPAGWLFDPERRWRTDPLISAHAIGGYHHMGTTRMASDPRRGVTDGDGRVHGLANLYVAGSSLFPTSGWANPTLTIVALALRTAERISRRIRQAAAPAEAPSVAAPQPAVREDWRLPTGRA